MATVVSQEMPMADEEQIKKKLEGVKARKPGPLTFMVTGKVGTGKSTLVNGLVGIEVAKTGDNLERVTEDVKDYPFKKNGIDYLVFDSPGLQDVGVEDKERIDEILRKLHGHKLDLLLYCINMSVSRIDQSDISAIKHITEGLSTKIWERSVFVLTFANEVKQSLFKKRLEDFENVLRKYVRKEITKLNPEDESMADTIPIVPAGLHFANEEVTDQWRLPDREDWFNVFWFTCAKRMEEPAAVCLVLSQANRFKTTSEKSKETSKTTKETSKKRKVTSKTTEETSEKSKVTSEAIHDRPIYVDKPEAGTWKEFVATEVAGAGIGAAVGYGTTTVAAKVGVDTIVATISIAGGPFGLVIGGIVGLSIAYVTYCHLNKK